MAITVDVLTKVVDSSVKGATDTIEKKFGQSGQKAGEEFGKALAAGVSRNPEIQRSFDKVADAAGKLRVETEKLNAVNAKANATDAQKIAQAERVEKAKREEARAVSAAADAYIRYNRDATNALDTVNRSATGMFNVLSMVTSTTRFGNLTSGLARMSAGFAEAGASAGALGASMTATAAIAGGTVVIGFAAAAAGAVALTDKLYDMGQQWDDVFDSLESKTGASGDVLSSLKTVVKDVAGVVPESIGTIGDLTAQVTQTMKLTTDQTEELVTSLGHLKHMGFDVDVHSLGMAFKALKVDQNDYVESLGQLKTLNSETGLSMDTITSAIEGNAGALQAFGFTWGQTLSIIEQFEQSGMDPNKGLGALSKAFKALTDAGLAPTKANLQQVFDEIKSFAASGQVDRANEELNQLFGPRGGGLAWLPLIQDGTLSLEDLANAAELPATNIQNLADSQYDLAESWALFKQNISSALEPLASELFNGLNEGLKSIMAWMNESKPEIIGFFTFVSTQVINFVEFAIGSFGALATAVGKTLGNIPLLSKVFGNWDEAGEKLMDFGAKLNDLQGKMQRIGDRTNTAAQVMREFNNNLKLMPDGKTVVLKDGSDEAISKIDKDKYRTEKMPDGTVKITANTREAEDELQAWIDDRTNKPIDLPVGANTDDFKRDYKDLVDEITGKPIPVPMVPSMPNTLPGMLSPGGSHKFAPSSYGMPSRANSGGYGGAGTQFPTWVYDVAETFGIKPSTYPNHQTSDRREPGYAPNPNHENRGIDWTGPVENLQRFADYLSTIPQAMEQVIWQNPYTGRKTGIGGGQINPGYYPQSTYDEHGGNDPSNIHVHTRQSRPIPLGYGNMRRFGPGGSDSNGIVSLSASGSAGMMNWGPDGSPLPPGTPSPIPGLQEGPVGSTFGYNEYGEPGYYRPDSDSIHSAERSKTNADKAVEKAEKRLGDLQKDIADLEAQRNTLNAKDTDKKIADKNQQIEDLKDQIADLKDSAGEANRRLEDARQGRFTPARESRSGKGSGSQLGGPLADDFGLSEGLPGVAKWLTTFLANLAFAPALGALSAAAGGSAQQTGYGMFGMMGAQNMANGLTPLGLSSGSAFTPGVTPSIGPAPIGGSVGPGLTPPSLEGQHGLAGGAAPGPGNDGRPQTSTGSVSPTAGPGGGGFQGLGGLPMQGINSAIAAGSLAIDAMAPGAGAVAGQAAQTGIQLANRTIGYMGQLAGIGVGGLMETFLPHGSPGADPGKSWIGKLAAGFAGARPALPNSAGGGQGGPAGKPAPPQTPEEAQKLAQQNGGGQSGGPMVNVENLNNYTPDGGQSVANQIGRLQMASYASGGAPMSMAGV